MDEAEDMETEPGGRFHRLWVSLTTEIDAYEDSIETPGAFARRLISMYLRPERQEAEDICRQLRAWSDRVCAEVGERPDGHLGYRAAELIEALGNERTDGAERVPNRVVDQAGAVERR